MSGVSNWFIVEIQQMMFAFGDSRRPLQETAALVEEIVHQQMVAMIEQASEVATCRGDKHIGIEDIVFLLRKDKVKLRRLLRFFEIKDMKAIIKSSLGAPEDVPGKSDLNIASIQEQQILETRVMGRNKQICYNFLSAIDQTGELVALFDDKETDTIKHERLLRAEMQSQGMDVDQYMEFVQARQANFGRRYKTQRFRDWLLTNFSPDVVLNAAAVDIFSYLAYETVAQIVDLALLVKQDLRAHPADALSKTRPALCINYTELYAGSLYGKSDTITAPSQSPPYDNSNSSQLNPAVGTTSLQLSAPVTPNKLNKRKRKKSGPSTSVEMSWDCTILPADVREAMRRYFTDIGPFASQIKMNSHSSPWYRTLCI
ncbi:hypothetical protein BsWGS_12255 [Bradybaena similaris]